MISGARIDTRPATLMSKDEADETVKKLNAESDDGWTYEAVHNPAGTGISFIKVFDENGDYLGEL